MTDLNQGASIEADLLPCPFCGGAPEIQTDGESGYWIECTTSACGSSTNIRIALMDDVCPLLVEQWNRRTPAAQVGAGELPLLPEPTIISGSGNLYGEVKVLNYARAAIEADRAQRAVPDRILQARDGYIAELEQRLADLRAQLAAKGQVEMSGDVLYAAWHKVGADVAGLRFSDFMRALAAPASAQPADDRQHMSHTDMLALCAANPAAASGLPLGAQPDQRESAAADVSIEALCAFLAGCAPIDGAWFGEEHPSRPGKFWWRDFLPAFRGAASPAAQPAKDEQNNGWQKLDDDFRLQFGRLVDVVLTNGVYEYGRRCNQVDWTQVQDWRYADSANNGADEQKGGA